MFRRARRYAVISSDSSDEGQRPQRRKRKRSTVFAQRNIHSNNISSVNFRKKCSQVKTQKDNDSSSDSSVMIKSRKQQRRIPISLSDDSSNSESEENPNLTTLRVQKICGTGNNTAGTSGVAKHFLHGVANHIIDNATTSIQRMDILDSSNNAIANCQKRVERQSSSSSFEISPRKWRKTHTIISSDEDSDSSENEEIFPFVRRGALRALSDYESGNSQNRGHILTLNRVGRLSDSSSDDDIIRTRLNSRRTPQINPTVTSDSSDSGIPVGFNRTRKRRRICSSEESDSHSPNRPSSNPWVVNIQNQTNRRTRNTRQSLTTTPLNDRNRRTVNNSTNRYNVGAWVLRTTRERIRSNRAAVSINETNRRGVNTDEANSGRTTRNIFNSPVTRTRPVNENNRATISSPTRHLSQREAISESQRSLRNTTSQVRTNMDSRNAAVLRSPDFLYSDNAIFAHNDTLLGMLFPSVSPPDSNDSFPLSRPIRRRIVSFDDSDEESELTTQSTALEVHDKKPEVSDSRNIPSSSSSDSDGESEKCPICLASFNSQEVGNPVVCEHSFCVSCIQQWAKSNNSCPVDRLPFHSIVVRTHLQGKVVREIPVETPPVANFWESEDWWETLALNYVVGNEFSSDSEYYYASEGDGPEERCCVCNGRENSDAMIICDFCIRVYHMACVSPPLQYVPATEWYCGNCTQGRVIFD